MKYTLLVFASIVCLLISCKKSDSNSNSSSSTTDSSYNTLFIPPILTGTTFNLTLSTSSKQFFKTGAATTTYGYNGQSIWGPTLIMNKGDNVQMNVTNGLSDTTTVHWHGFHVPAKMDGGPHQKIAPNATWSPNFTVMCRWFHNC